MHWSHLSLVAAALDPGAPPPAEPRPPAEPTEEVVVRAVRPEAVEEIDRRVYTPGDDPVARSGPIIDFLGVLPSVVVTPDGRVRLLGVGEATILIDGRRPLNPTLALRTLMGADVDRVEVITNPSAQFEARGTGGIINIVTRKSTRPGVTGSVVFNLDSLGSSMLSASPSLTRGRWTFGGTAAVSDFDGASDRTRRRRILDPAGEVDLVEAGRTSFSNQRRAARLRTVFRPTGDQAWGLSFDVQEAPGRQVERRRVSSTAPAVDPYDERVDTRSAFDIREIGFDYERTGGREGERLGLSLTGRRAEITITNVISVTLNVTAKPDRTYLTTSAGEVDQLTLKIDHKRPFDGSILLSSGAYWEQVDEIDRRTSVDLAGAGGLGPEYDRRRETRRTTAAAFATLQFPWGRWTVMPGVRVEADRLDLHSAGVRNTDLQAFPSLHLRRPVSESVTLNLSYSERVSRPFAGQLDPLIVYTSPTRAVAGEPDLRPETLHALEARIEAKPAGLDAALTVYERRSDDAFSDFTRLIDGDVALTTPINAGRKVSRGAELALRGAAGERWRFAVTGNLFQLEREVIEAGARRRVAMVAHSANGFVEHRARGSDDRPGDQVQLSARWLGPQRTLQGETPGFVQVDLTWRRPLTERVHLALTVNDLFATARSGARLTTPELVEQDDVRLPARVVRLALTYRLGPAGR